MTTGFPKIKKNLAPHGRVKQHVGERSRTQQNMAEETDINRIMSKYQKTGVITHVARYAGTYGDFSIIPDYKTGIERIRAGEEMFMTLPAKIREKFANNAGEFIEYATNPENIEGMRELGLAPKIAPEAVAPPLEGAGGNKPPKAAQPQPAPSGDQ